MVTLFPNDQATFEMDDQFMVGTHILAKPVVTENAQSTEVYLPGNGQVWYDGNTLQLIGPGRIDFQAPLSTVPFFFRGGSIIPKKERIRRSSAIMAKDPYTLMVALDREVSFPQNKTSKTKQKIKHIYWSKCFE